MPYAGVAEDRRERGPAQSASLDRCRRSIAARCGRSRLIVVANREPFSHYLLPDGTLAGEHSTSGLVTALEPLIAVASGTWIAHGSGTGDRMAVDSRDGLDVGTGDSRYRLRRVWLDADDVAGYYDGFANEGLWPLCHRVHVRPVFRSDDVNTYWRVNSRFADAVVEESGGSDPVVLVQDYHFALAPRLIRERLPRARVATFWHIPWPGRQVFEICPWAADLVQGLLGAQVVGFQTPADCRNFLDTVGGLLEAQIDTERQSVTYGGFETLVRAYPASIPWPHPLASSVPPASVCRESVRRALGLPLDARLGVGIARLDYTKGIEEGLAAVELLLETFPEYRDSFTFVQVAEPSRTSIPAYRAVGARVREAVRRINARFARTRTAVMLVDRHVEPAGVFTFLRAADLCYIGSLHDGMNLVAKEFVAARDDGEGVLVLSGFAGAARELTDALIVNPYGTDGVAHALARGLSMSPVEQRERLARMRGVLTEACAFRWADSMLADLSRLTGAHAAPRGFSDVLTA